MKDKRNIVIIILLIIFVLLSIYVYIDKSINIIYLGNYTKITSKNGKIDITNKNNKINLTKAKIYFNGDFIKGYIKSDKSDINNKTIIYNAYNEDGKILRFSDDLIAYTGDEKIKVADANILDILLESDYNLLIDFVNNKSDYEIETDYDIEFKNFKKVIYDLDDDGQLEYLYSFELDEGTELAYTCVFIIDGDEYKIVESTSGELYDVNLNRISFFNLIDFNNDNKYEVVLRLKTGDYENNIYKIYNYDDKIVEIK